SRPVRNFLSFLSLSNEPYTAQSSVDPTSCAPIVITESEHVVDPSTIPSIQVLVDSAPASPVQTHIQATTSDPIKNPIVISEPEIVLSNELTSKKHRISESDIVNPEPDVPLFRPILKSKGKEITVGDSTAKDFNV
ncbi:unnamed protein product, partial [Ilex paraguariensis]